MLHIYHCKMNCAYYEKFKYHDNFLQWFYALYLYKSTGKFLIDEVPRVYSTKYFYKKLQILFPMSISE